MIVVLAAAENADWLTRCATCPTCWALGLGSLGLWLLIPGGRFHGYYTWAAGWLLAVVAAVLFAIDLPQFGELGVQIVFWLLGLVTLGSAVAMISARSPVYSALWFAMSLMGSAGLLLMQGAQFLGGATIVVYAGAIVVTFLFVIMLAQPEGHAVYDRLSWGWFPRPAAILSAAVLLGLIAAAMQGLKREVKTPSSDVARTVDQDRVETGEEILHPQHMATLGARLFTRQLVAVEVAGTLLMAALVGAIAIAIHGKQRQNLRSQDRTVALASTVRSRAGAAYE